MLKLLSRILLTAGIWLWLCGPPSAFADDRDPAHDEAVELARSGDYEAALEIIARLRRESPQDLDLIYDETVILVWAGRAELSTSLVTACLLITAGAVIAASSMLKRKV